MAPPPLVWRCASRSVECGQRTLLMGVLNVTPDSFSDGGQFFDPEAAVSHGLALVEDGADIVDVGGESTRPGSAAVTAIEEIERILPVVKRLAAELPGTPISIDTQKAEVAVAALEAGASIVNDVSGGRDPRMFEVVREGGAGMVLMHMRGDPATMQELTEYRDVVADVFAELRERVESAAHAGVAADAIAVDPGLGFAKTAAQNFVLMRDVERFLELGRPLVIGPSRKSFIGKVLGTDVDQRVEGTAGAVAWLAGHGAHIVRVHDVRAMKRVTAVVDAIRAGGEGLDE